LVNAETVAWQGRIFWQLAGSLPRIARWDRQIDFGAVLRPGLLAGRLDNAVRGAFPVARLVETGTRDAIMVLVLLGVLLWQDARDMVVLVFLSLLFVPAYAMALSRLVRMQAKSNASLARLRQPVISLLTSDAMSRAGRAIDSSRVPAVTTNALSRSFGNQSLLLNEQNAVTVVAGVHVFASFYGVYLSEGRSLTALPASKLTFFFFLLLMLRSLIGLIGLVSRLSRGYERLGLLRSLLYPADKPAGVETGPPLRFAVALPGATTPPPTAGAGDTIVLVAPDINFGFHLLPIANALRPLFPRDPRLAAHIPLLREDDLAALLAGGVIAGEAAQLRLPHAGPVDLVPAPVDLATTPVVALTFPAWKQLVRDKAVAQANSGRLLIITFPGRKLQPSLPAGALYALSDGRTLTALGTRSHIEAALAGPTAATKPTAEEDEEDGET
jgi:hypothetical protein